MVERFVAALRESGVTVESRNASNLFDEGAGPQVRVAALLRLNDKSWLAIEVTRSGYRYSAGMEETLRQISQRIGSRDGFILILPCHIKPAKP